MGIKINKDELVSRLREPSTYAGLGLLAALLGHKLDIEVIAQAGYAVGGLLSIFLPELGSAKRGEQTAQRTRATDAQAANEAP